MSLLLALTTAPDAAMAERLARGAVEARLCACAQVEAPIRSFYRWEGKVEAGEEVRVVFKLLPEQAAGLEAWVHAHHSYSVPQWVVLPVTAASENYLRWARSLN